MMALRNRVQEQPPGEIEALLPWHAAGTLNARDAQRVDEALAGNPGLARQYQAVRDECAEIIVLVESLGAPSSRAMHNLFAAIDAEPARETSSSKAALLQLATFFARLSPHKLMASAAICASVLLLQAGMIGGLMMQRGALPPVTYSIAPVPAMEAGARVLVRFTPAASMADITALLDVYQATILDGGGAGLFRLQLGRLPMTAEQVAGWVSRLQSEKIVSSAVAAP